MVLAILGDEEKVKEFQTLQLADGTEIIFADSFRSFTVIDADVYLYLNDIQNPDEVQSLKLLSDRPLIINSVCFTSRQFHVPIIRLNGWNTMLSRSVAEVSIGDHMDVERVKSIFSSLEWPCEIVPDIAGMIVPRIISSVINEAYFTLESGVSTREEIDLAMRLGTNYPYGPFEWSRKIGLINVKCLLQELSRTDSRYTPCTLLSSEADKL